jgi:hypothetical protein
VQRRDAGLGALGEEFGLQDAGALREALAFWKQHQAAPAKLRSAEMQLEAAREELAAVAGAGNREVRAAGVVVVCVCVVGCGLCAACQGCGLRAVGCGLRARAVGCGLRAVGCVPG